MLGFCPVEDPKGILLRIDYYALRAKEYSFLLSFIGHRPGGKLHVRELLPNFLLAGGLAKRHVAVEESKQNERIQAAWTAVVDGVTDGKLERILDSPLPEADVMLALLLYPGMMRDMLEKTAKKQISQVFKKSWYVGYQAKSWRNILDSPLFLDTILHNWMGTEEAAAKVFDIIIARSSLLYQDDETLMWLRETVGFAVTKLDVDDTIRGMLRVIVGKADVIDNQFSWERYRALK